MKPLTARRRRHLLAGAAVALGLPIFLLATALPAAAATNLVSDGSFTTPTVAPTLNGSGYDMFCATGVTHTGTPACDTASPALDAWTVTSGSVDVYSTAQQASPTDDPGAQSLDLDGLEEGSISQSIPLTAGTAVLSFEVDGNLAGCGPAVKTLDFGINNAANSFTYDPTIDSGWVTETLPISIPVNGSYTVQFASTTPGDCGAVITNISVVPTTGTPLASGSIAAGAVGFLAVLGGGWVVWRRRRSAGQPV